MKLYYAPGACSLADHIALHEAGAAFQRIRVDLKAKRTEDGRDYSEINPKGYVPTLELDGGERITENVAVLDWIAHQAPALKPQGPLGHTRVLEMLAFISTEIHKSFKPFFSGASDADKAKAGEQIGKRLGYLAERLQGDYLLGGFGVADCYLFVMLTWAKKNNIPLPEPLPAYFDRIRARPAVQMALAHEGQA
jgi:glutathione S-transferase